MHARVVWRRISASAALKGVMAMMLDTTRSCRSMWQCHAHPIIARTKQKIGTSSIHTQRGSSAYVSWDMNRPGHVL